MALRPQFFYKGGFYNSPVEIRMLQFNQLRSHLYPRDPYLAAQSLEEFGRAVPQYMPGRMANTRWKTPPTTVAWGENVASSIAATTESRARVSRLQQAANLPPMMPFPEAPEALGLNHLPAMPLDPNLDAEPISRGVLPYDRMHLHADELAALVREQDYGLARQQRDTQDRRDVAMMSVHQQVSAISNLVTGGDVANEEWYEQGSA